MFKRKKFPSENIHQIIMTSKREYRKRREEKRRSTILLSTYILTDLQLFYFLFYYFYLFIFKLFNQIKLNLFFFLIKKSLDFIR